MVSKVGDTVRNAFLFESGVESGLLTICTSASSNEQKGPRER